MNYLYNANSDISSDIGVERTIASMHSIVNASMDSNIVRGLASNLLSPGISDRVAIERVWAWIRNNVTFKGDESIARNLGFRESDNTEVLIHPEVIISKRMREGDCDDYVMLAATLLGAMGIDSRFVTIAAIEGSKRFSHVYLEAWDRGSEEWIAFDGSHGKWLGWKADEDSSYREVVSRRKVWSRYEIRGKEGLRSMSNTLLSGAGDDSRGIGTIDWGGILNTSIKSGFDILKNVTYPSGLYQQDNQGVAYRQPIGVPGLNLGFQSFPSSGGINPYIVMIGGAALVLVLILGNRR